jgi:hypothetical protein
MIPIPDITLPTAIALAIALVASTAAANAAGKKIEYPAEMLGVWCQARTENGWAFFERGKCAGAVNSIVLSPNGDYLRIAPLSERVSIEERCRAIPKSYFKGWTDYVCTINNTTEKRHHKWTLEEGYAAELGLSNAEWAQ